jgi:hypothetical protein
MKHWMILCLFLIGVSPGWANSLKLKNDSPYTLRVVIRGGDNSFLSELVLNTQHSITWTDVYGRSGYYGAPNSQMQEGYKSKTPYTLIWYCMDGSDYSMCTNIATGSFVTAQRCQGRCTCSAKKPEKYPTEPQGQFLQPEPETP